MTESSPNDQTGAPQRPTDTLPGVQHVIAVGAGKGGVGKSTIAVLAAVGLIRRGFKAGLLDGNVYGPSLPKLTGTEDRRPDMDDQGRILPVETEGLKVISMGHLMNRDQAVIWRGPMAQKWVKELLDRTTGASSTTSSSTCRPAPATSRSRWPRASR